MLPLKKRHDHEQIQKLKPVQVVDLRDYGLEASAPCEDGEKVLVFKLSEAGTLLPAS